MPTAAIVILLLPVLTLVIGLIFFRRDALLAAVTAAILVLAFGILYVSIILSDQREYSEAFEMYCPASCPNTLWTCSESDIYFASDENGMLWGAAKNNGEVTLFNMFFTWPQGQLFVVSELKSFSYPSKDPHPFCFRGDASFSEGECTIVYQASDDNEHYFGEREGEVTLTFVMSNLTAPFSFGSERSLNELPFMWREMGGYK